MKTSFSTPRRGFTLVEMLAVITIIVILAGMVLGLLKFAKEKENSSKAKIQVGYLSEAIQKYKSDFGNYPPSTSDDGTAQSAALRKALYLDGANDTTHKLKIYLGDLDEGDKQGWISGTGDAAKIIDPWGNEYRYRTGSTAMNPDFDLWSIGKDGVTNADDPKDAKSQDDVHN